MTIAIYALRLKGDTEVRYIGQSANPAERLRGHISHARGMPWRTDFAEWLVRHESEIEVVLLTTAETREDARCVERTTVATFVALDHRLFNQWLVPAEKRARSRTSPAPALYRRAA